jgi:hypothetical protein
MPLFAAASGWGVSSCIRNGSSGENVTPLARVLNIGIRRPLDNVLNLSTTDVHRPDGHIARQSELQLAIGHRCDSSRLDCIESLLANVEPLYGLGLSRERTVFVPFLLAFLISLN